MILQYIYFFRSADIEQSKCGTNTTKRNWSTIIAGFIHQNIIDCTNSFSYYSLQLTMKCVGQATSIILVLIPRNISYHWNTERAGEKSIASLVPSSSTIQTYLRRFYPVMASPPSLPPFSLWFAPFRRLSNSALLYESPGSCFREACWNCIPSIVLRP